MSQRISALSKEYVKVQVSATESGAAIDPTPDVVAMAIVTGTPVSGDFHTATWETAGTKYYARLLVGPGAALTLTPGTYGVWVKVTDSPEVPVKRSGALVVY